MTTSRAVPVIGVALFCIACGNEGTASKPSAAPADGGDKNATFETADPVKVDSLGVFDMVDGREDEDFFSFDGRAGEWVEIRSSYFDPIFFADTRLALFDSAHEQLAYNPYVKSLRGENVLSRIVTRLPTDGKYFVRVDDPEGPPIQAGLSQAYRLSVTELATMTDGYTIEVDSASDATAVSFHDWSIDSVTIEDSFVVGGFSDGADVDRFSFTVGPGELRTLNAEVLESGSQADGSTTPAGKVWLTDDSGTTVIARIDNAIGQAFLAPPLEPGSYALWVSHPDTDVGGNDFYVIRTLLGPDNPVESAESTNGTLASAEPLTTTSSQGQTAAFVLAHVLDQDVDYFLFDGQAGLTASVYCESAEAGSGLVGLHVSVRDESDRTLSEATEVTTSANVPGSTVALENITMPTGGHLYIRTSKDSQLPDVAGDWVRCAVYEQ